MAAVQASDDKVDAAIATLLKLKAVNPKDQDGLTQLASLYLRKADNARLVAVNAQANAQGTADPTAFAPAATSPFGKVFKSFSAPLSTAISTGSSTKFNDAYTKMTAAYGQAVGAYQDVAKVSPNDPSIQFALAQTAEQATDTKTAITAYKRFLKLAPEDPTAPAIRQRIKQLNQQAQLPTVSTG
jgi:cytochrome c-type biogenesis protein CcmH/NrfG